MTLFLIRLCEVTQMDSDKTARILHSADAHRDFVVRVRRDLHKHAEVAWTEFRTGSLAARDLLNLGGWDVKYGPMLYEKSLMMGMPSEEALERHAERAIAQGGDKQIIDAMRGGYTGVVATLKTGDGDGPTVAFRVDIDANDLQEAHDEKHRPFREGFASVNDNADHACGHDCHTAIGLTAAHVIHENRHLLPPGTVKIIFQTGEEGGRGGQPMAAAGVADDADYFMGIHMALGDMGKGVISCSVAKQSNSIKSDVTFTGVPAHAGSRPEVGKNALLAACNAAMNLYAITRHSGGNTRVNVGVLEAGVGRNVIPPNAFMKIEVRGETRELMNFMQERAVEIVEGAAKMYGVQHSIKKAGETVSAPMDREMIDLVAETARQIPEVNRVIRQRQGTGGGEDCTFFMLRVQERGGKATIANIGTVGPAVGHNSYYDIDEDSLVTGVKLMSLVALNALGRGRVR
jgi:aminobenzoyl-glutamate utilization protein A